MPKVTVIVPVYNVGAYVGEAIQSVLNQTYSDFILLVMDDCSTDNTVQIVQSIHDSRIRLERNTTNLGLAENLNRGLSLIDTEYVARFDGDDIAEPDWLAENMAVLESHPEIGICSSGFEWFGTRDGIHFYPEKHEDSICQMLFGCTVITPVFRKSVFDINKIRYKTFAFPAEDYRVWAECYRATKVYNIQKVLFHYRMHDAQISTSRRQQQIEKHKEVQRFMLEWLNPNICEEDKRFFIEVFSSQYMQSLQELPKWNAFADKIIAYNTLGHFDAKSLRKRLRKQIDAAVSHLVLETYFPHRYSLQGWLRWLTSGYMACCSPKFNAKLFVKSLSFRKR